MKELIGKHITTLMGLTLLIFGSLDLYRVSTGEAEFRWQFTASMVVSGLFLIMTSDRYIKSKLNDIVGNESRKKD